MAEASPEIISSEDIEREINIFKEEFNRNKNKFEKFDDFIKSKLEEWKNITVNIAVIGEIGAGKSTLINHLRNISDLHPDAAKVDCNEVNHDNEGTPYPDPSNPHLVYYDFPGYGAPKVVAKISDISETTSILSNSSDHLEIASCLAHNSNFSNTVLRQQVASVLPP